MTHEFECMACGTGFGKERVRRATSKGTRAKVTMHTATYLAMQQKPRVKQNGLLEPKVGSSAWRVWTLCDTVNESIDGAVPSVRMVRDASDDTYNLSQIGIEYYQWKKFHGFNNEIRGA